MPENSNDQFRGLLQDVINRSEEHFEQKITYISAGALVLSLTLIEKIIDFTGAVSIIFLILGWVILACTLFINLVSHQISKVYVRMTLKEIDKDLDLSTIITNVRKRNIRIEKINWGCIFLLALGIISIIIFTSINALEKSN